MRLLVTAIAAAFISSVNAQAQTIATFSYKDPNNGVDLTGQLSGNLFGGYFTVNGVNNLYFNGSAIPFAAAYDGSVDAFYGLGNGYNGNGSAVVALNGSYMDWEVFFNGDGFLFADEDLYSAAIGNPVFMSGPSFGEENLEFNPAYWTLNVSEPSSATLIGCSLGAVVFMRRRRSARP